MNLKTILPSVASANGNWFNKSDYWFRWSRCLVRADGNDRAIDISIEPLNFVDLDHAKRYSDYELNKFLEMRIRQHRTYQPEHRFSMELPGGTADYVKQLVGEELFNFLIHEDILSEIDMEKLAYYDRCDNWPWGGGIPFAMVCKDRDKYPLIINHWIKVMEKEVHYLKVQDDDMIRRYNDYLKQEPAQ